jgi:hypothetical protein
LRLSLSCVLAFYDLKSRLCSCFILLLFLSICSSSRYSTTTK